MDFSRFMDMLDSDSDDGWGYKIRDEEEEEEDSDKVDSAAANDYAGSLLKDINRLQSKFSDIAIVVNGRVFHGHRNILAAASHYFEDMFSSGFQDSSTGNANEVELKDMDSAIFELIFKFMYSGQMTLTKDTAVTACQAAAFLGIRNVEKVFINFFERALRKKLIRPEDILCLWPGVDKYGMKRLSASASRDLRKHFKELVKSDQFVKRAPYDLINDYLIYEMKNFGSEEQLLGHVIRWLKYDWDKRKQHTHTFLKRFRLALLPQDKVRELMDAQILEIPECKKILDDLIKTWMEFEGVGDLLKLPKSLLPEGITRTLISFGGEREIMDGCYRHEVKAREMMLFAHYYNKRTKQWTLLNYPQMPGDHWELGWPSMVVVNRDIYLAGGLRNVEYSDDVYCDSKQFFRLDGNSYKWSKLPSMSEGRFIFSLVHHEGFLYAIGGRKMRRKPSKVQGYLESAERFNISQQRWDRVYKLPAEMAYTSTAILNGKILVYGVSDCEEVGGVGEYKLLGFDPVTENWTEYLQEKYVAVDEAPDSVLAIHDNACYRVKYEQLKSAIPLPCLNSYEFNPWSKAAMRFTPRVHRVDMKPVESGEEGSIRASIGHEVEGQDAIAPNEGGAFHIDGHIYINIHRFVHDTGVIQSDDTNKWKLKSLDDWRECYSLGKGCVVEYAFDSKKMR